METEKDQRLFHQLFGHPAHKCWASDVSWGNLGNFFSFGAEWSSKKLFWTGAERSRAAKTFFGLERSGAELQIFF